jgi:hypothetical protein
MKSKIMIAFAGLFLFVAVASGQKVTFQVTTVSYGGTYAPKHCFAMWVTNASGTYVQTINRQSYTYTKYLTNWVSKTGWTSSGKAHATDGITGASLNSHNYAYTSTAKTTSRIPFIWDCKDYNGNVVADGTYYINIEFTEKNTTGVTAKYTFVKGSTNQTVSYTNVSSYYTNATLTYEAPVSALVSAESTKTNDIIVAGDLLLVRCNITAYPATKMEIFSMTGKLLRRQSLTSSSTNYSLTSLPSGTYLVTLSNSGKRFCTKKIIH